MEVSWDRVSDLWFSADDSSVVVGSFISNFASVWRVDLDAASEPRAKAAQQSPSLRRGSAPRDEPRRPGGDEVQPSNRVELRAKVRGEGKEDDAEPKVSWESGASRRDLSASMGESFMRRVREQQLEQGQRGGRRDAEAPVQEDAAAALEDERLSMEALKGLLPSPRKPQAKYEGEEGKASTPKVRRQHSLGDLNPAFRASSGNEMLAKQLPSKLAQDFPDEEGGMNVVGSRFSGQSGAESKEKGNAGVAEVLSAGTRVLPQLTQRIGLVRILRKFWERGEVTDIIAQLVTMHEGARHDRVQMLALGDFFGATELNSLTLTLDVCVALLPILERMASDSGEFVVSAAFKGIVTLLSAFADLIRQTRATISVGGVDLSREERLRKCTACHEILVRIKSSLPVLRNKFRQNKELVALMESVKQMVNDYA